MAAESSVLKAKTKKELRKQVTQWIKQAKRRRMTIQSGWNEEAIKQTDDGYQIYVRAHY